MPIVIIGIPVGRLHEEGMVALPQGLALVLLAGILASATPALVLTDSSVLSHQFIADCSHPHLALDGSLHHELVILGDP